MDVTRLDLDIVQIGIQLLGHSLGQGGHQHTLLLLLHLADLLQQVIDLVHAGPHLDNRIEQPRGTYHLFHIHAFALLQLVIGRSGTDIDHLSRQSLELVKLQRSVVQGGRQPEAILHQGLLT